MCCTSSAARQRIRCARRHCPRRSAIRTVCAAQRSGEREQLGDAFDRAYGGSPTQLELPVTLIGLSRTDVDPRYSRQVPCLTAAPSERAQRSPWPATPYRRGRHRAPAPSVDRRRLQVDRLQRRPWRRACRLAGPARPLKSLCRAPLLMATCVLPGNTSTPITLPRKVSRSYLQRRLRSSRPARDARRLCASSAAPARAPSSLSLKLGCGRRAFEQKLAVRSTATPPAQPSAATVRSGRKHRRCPAPARDRTSRALRSLASRGFAFAQRCMPKSARYRPHCVLQKVPEAAAQFAVAAPDSSAAGRAPAHRRTDVGLFNERPNAYSSRITRRNYRKPSRYLG